MPEYVHYKSVSTRLLAIILRLSQSTHWSPGALADDLGVVERTIYRDLTRIRSAGLPIRFDPDRGGYILDWSCPVEIPYPKLRTQQTRPSKPRWRDRETTCGQCGRKFIWRAQAQRDRARNIRAGNVKPGTPPFCSRACATRHGALARKS